MRDHIWIPLDDTTNIPVTAHPLYIVHEGLPYRITGLAPGGVSAAPLSPDDRATITDPASVVPQTIETLTRRLDAVERWIGMAS